MKEKEKDMQKMFSDKEKALQEKQVSVAKKLGEAEHKAVTLQAGKYEALQYSPNFNWALFISCTLFLCNIILFSDSVGLVVERNTRIYGSHALIVQLLLLLLS